VNPGTNIQTLKSYLSNDIGQFNKRELVRANCVSVEIFIEAFKIQ